MVVCTTTMIFRDIPYVYYKQINIFISSMKYSVTKLIEINYVEIKFSKPGRKQKI